jgi:protoporphyrinogen oxidase
MSFPESMISMPDRLSGMGAMAPESEPEIDSGNIANNLLKQFSTERTKLVTFLNQYPGDDTKIRNIENALADWLNDRIGNINQNPVTPDSAGSQTSY